MYGQYGSKDLAGVARVMKIYINSVLAFSFMNVKYLCPRTMRRKNTGPPSKILITSYKAYTPLFRPCAKRTVFEGFMK